MSDDDDLPPPLEDMTEQLQTSKQKLNKENIFSNYNKSKDHTEEIRLAPKKESSIPQKDENYDFDKNKKQEIQKSQQNKGFGGFQAGFLNQKPKVQKQKVEDLTHLKAQKDKNENLKFKEVQEAMTNNLEKTKNEWMTPDFIQKLSSNPILMQAFSNPQYMQIFKEMGSNPKETIAKYGNSPEFREFMQEFSKLMGSHFESVADKKKREEEEKRKEEEEKLKNDPVYQTIQNDQKVKEYLEDPEVQEILNHLRFKGGLDLHEVMREKPLVGQKLMFLIQKGVLNASSQQ